jgi:hypothetical protein
VAHIPVSMASDELDVCPECHNLIYKSEGAWLDVWLSGPYYADTEAPHKHQPVHQEDISMPQNNQSLNVTAILSDPMYVRPTGASEDAPKSVGMVAMVNGERTVLTLTEDVVGQLLHALEHGHLPE